MSNIISVSITSEQASFIEEMDLSPSKLLQARIDEIQESNKVNVKQIQDRERKIAFLMETINKQRDFIEAKGLMNEFCEKC